MKIILNKLRIIKQIAIVTYKEWAAYRTHSLVSVFVGPIHFLVQVIIWTAIYQTQSTINGLNLHQMLTYYGISTLIVYLTMDFADWNLQMLIHSGKYITFTLRPIHHRFFALSQKIGHRILGFVFEFIPVLLIFVFVFKIDLSPDSMVWSVTSIILSFLMTFYINYCIGLLGFWLTRTNGIKGMIRLVTNVFSGAFIPLAFFPQTVQNIMFFLPFQYTIYIPSMVYTGSYELLGFGDSPAVIVGIQALYVVIMWILSEVLYRFGNRRFMGVGG